MVNIQETLHKCWICVSGATGTDDILVEGGCYFRPIYLLKPFHVDRNPFDPNIFILTDSMKKNVTFYGLEVQEIPGYFEFTGATSGETLDNLEWQLLECQQDLVALSVTHVNVMRKLLMGMLLH